MNYRLTLAFCGTSYHGWQVQQNARTVSGTVQDAAEAVLGRRYDLTGCSRTDSGVHASGFVAVLRTDKSLAPSSLQKALNVKLPPDISVLDCREAPPDFHPRYGALAKRYLYLYYDSPARNPFYRDRMWHSPQPLEETRMDRAARLFLGRHNFSAFCAAGGKIPEEERFRTLYDCSVRREGEKVLLSVTGDGFLYHMVRIMAGTLLEVSRGKIALEDIGEIIASRDRSRAGLTAPSCGLYLDHVFYEEGGIPHDGTC